MDDIPLKAEALCTLEAARVANNTMEVTLVMVCKRLLTMELRTKKKVTKEVLNNVGSEKFAQL